MLGVVESGCYERFLELNCLIGLMLIEASSASISIKVVFVNIRLEILNFNLHSTFEILDRFN